MDSSFANQYDSRSAVQQPEGQVGVALQQQQKLLEILAAAVEQLENRLGYGLRPSPPSVVSRDDRGGGAPGPAPSTLADTLRAANARINDANARLTDITSRVDL